MQLILTYCLAALFWMPAVTITTSAIANPHQEAAASNETVDPDAVDVENAQLGEAAIEVQATESESGIGILDRIKESLESFRFSEPVFKTDPVIFGVLMVMLGIIFYASSQSTGRHWPILIFIVLAAAGIGFVAYTNSMNASIETATPDAVMAEGIADEPVESEIPPLTFEDDTLMSILKGVCFYILPLALVASLLAWTPMYKVIPMLLMCYFAPSLLTAFGWVDPEGSKLYYVATRYMLPASLVLLTISVDLREIFKLGPKALIMFFTGTVGVILGGPLAVFVVSFFNPDIVGGVSPAEIWRGLSTVAGSWIGGGANQAAMKEIFLPDTEIAADNARINELYSVMVAVDVLVAEFWMIFLLLGVGKAKQIDKFFNADASAVERLQEKMEEFSQSTARVPSTTDFFVILAFGFGVTALCHFIGDWIAPWLGENISWANRFSLDSKFFWLIVLATTFGVLFSFTSVRNYEGAGASKIGTVCIFILVATIGLKMDIIAIFERPGLFLVGGIWMLFHVVLLFVVGYLIRAPYFFLAVGSKANIGGAASAPVVAAAFHPSLAPVGVLLAVLGYAVGTYGAWLCAIMMEAVSP